MAKDRCRVARDVSNKSGLEFDVARDIREIALSYIEEAEGNISLAEVVRKVKKDVPGIQDVDVWNSLGNRIDSNQKRQSDAVKEQQKRLTAQAKLEAKLEDALNGIFEKQKKGEEMTSQEIQVIRDDLRKLQVEASKNIRDEAQKARVLKEIESVRELLRDDVVRVDEKQDKAVVKQTDAMRDQLRDLKQQVAAKGVISELEAKLAGVEESIDTPTRSGTSKPSAELKKLRAKRDALRAEIRARKSLKLKIASLEAELNDQPRARAKKGETPVNSQVVQVMLDEVAELKAKLKAKKDADKENLTAAQQDKKKQDLLSDIENKIKKVQKGNKPMPIPRRNKDPEVEAARKRYREALKSLKTKESIEDLKKQITDKDYRIRVQQEREAKKAARPEVTDDMVRLQIEKKNLQQVVNDLVERNRERSLLEKLGRPFIELNLAFRGLILSGELGFVGRQTVTWFLNPFYTAKTAKNIVKTLMQAFTEKGGARVNAELQQHPEFIDAQRSGIFFRDLDHEFTASEEATQSWLLRKVPGLKQFIALNDRLMSTYINLMTHDIYFSYTESNPNATREQRKSMAKLINASAGRGQSLGVEKWGNAAKHVMLAPRFMISRFEAPARAGAIAFGKGSSMGDRIFIAKQWGGFMATGFTVLGLASMMDGVEIGDDPESSDFLKIIWGDKRIDIWGGFLQPAQLFGRMVMGMGRCVGVVDDKKKWNARDAKDELGNFIGNRMSPIANVINTAYSRETFDREKVPSLKDAVTDMEAAEVFAKRFILPQVSPIIGQETVDAYQLEGIESAAVSFGLNMIGVGTSTYD
jgi:hypothetical protein